MKKISDTITSLSSRDINQLMKILKVKGRKMNKSGDIISSLLSYSGMQLILSELTINELNVLKLACLDKNGITFNEISRILNIDTANIEKITNNLTDKLLIHILKNRQKINNKLDKVFIIDEVYNLLNPITGDSIPARMRIMKERIITNQENINKFTWKNDYSNKLINYIYMQGGIITLAESLKIIPEKLIDEILSELKEKDLIHICHDLDLSSNTYILLNNKLFFFLSEKYRLNKGNDITIHNGYYFLINLLKTFDIVSTYGLYMTKQNEFRKVDIKRLSDAMLAVHDNKGIRINNDDSSKFSLYLLSLLNCITTNNNALIISLEKIHNIIEDPMALLLKVLDLMNMPEYKGMLFPPFKMPAYREIISISKLIKDTGAGSYEYFKSAYLAEEFEELNIEKLSDLSNERMRIIQEFEICIRFICMTGIIDIRNGLLTLSDIGENILYKLQNKTSQIDNETRTDKSIKVILLNTDLTMIIPAIDISSKALYHLLTHTEIIKDDVILNTRISRESILSAIKRGMSNKVFILTLNKYSKKGIPGNLDFLINEWSEQAIRLNITNTTLLRTSHPSFIDEIAHSNIKAAIIERISDYFAIIDDKYLDRLIKAAKKRDAIINLYNDKNT